MKQKNPKARAELKQERLRKQNAQAAADRSYRSLMRHQDRYVKAYCAHFSIPQHEFEKYELVCEETTEPTVTGGWAISRSARMVRRTS